MLAILTIFPNFWMILSHFQQFQGSNFKNFGATRHFLYFYLIFFMIQGLVRARFRAENAAKNRKELAAGIWGWGINWNF